MSINIRGAFLIRFFICVMALFALTAFVPAYSQSPSPAAEQPVSPAPTSEETSPANVDTAPKAEVPAKNISVTPEGKEIKEPVDSEEEEKDDELAETANINDAVNLSVILPDYVWLFLVVFEFALAIFISLVLIPLDKIIAQARAHFFMLVALFGCLMTSTIFFYGQIGIVGMIVALFVFPLTGKYLVGMREENPWRANRTKWIARLVTFSLTLVLVPLAYWATFRLAEPEKLKTNALENLGMLTRAVEIFNGHANRYPWSGDAKNPLSELTQVPLNERNPLTGEYFGKMEYALPGFNGNPPVIPSESVSGADSRWFPSGRYMRRNYVRLDPDDSGGWLYIKPDKKNKKPRISLNYNKPLSRRWGALVGENPSKWRTEDLYNKNRKYENNYFWIFPRTLWALLGVIGLAFLCTAVSFFSAGENAALEWVAALRNNIILLWIMGIFFILMRMRIEGP